MEVATSLSVESFLCDRNSEPLRRGPRARAARCTRVPLDSTDGVFRRYLPARSRDSRARARTKRQKNKKTGRNNRQEARIRLCRNKTSTTNQPTSSAPFCSAGLRPSLRPALCSTPLRGASRKVSKGGVPPPWSRHTAHPPIGSELLHPSPFSPSATTIRLKIQAGDSGGRNSGGRCPSVPPREPLLQLPRFLHPSRGDRGCAVRVGWRS